jgi:alkylation response protein AidB-like acyl-CoA dehydrogenase
MFADAIEDILRDQCTPAQVRVIEAGGSPSRLWSSLSEAGFLDLLRPEEEGGAALPLPELFPLLAMLGRYAVPVPIAQSIAVRALLETCVALPDGLLTVAPALVQMGGGKLHCPRVPFGAIADHVVAADGDQLVLLDATTARRDAFDIEGSQVASLVWDTSHHKQLLAGDARALVPMTAAVLAALMAGAMVRVFKMTLQYCNDRQQFGRPLGKFQAVQHQLSVMAEKVAAVSIAAEAAFETHSRTPTPLRAANAKAVASEAVPLLADTAHALHGAIGVTEEYDLQLYTRRLREWRWAHGAESYWNQYVGNAVLASQGSVTEFVRAM